MLLFFFFFSFSNPKKVNLSAVSSEALTVAAAAKRVRRDTEVDEYGSDVDDDARAGHMKAKIEGMMEESYTRYLRRRAPGSHELRGTKSAKRSKKLVALKAASLANEDGEGWDGDAYVKLLTGDASSDDGSSSDDDEVSPGRSRKGRAMKKTTKKAKSPRLSCTVSPISARTQSCQNAPNPAKMHPILP